MIVELNQLKTENITLPDQSIVEHRAIRVNGKLVTFIDKKLSGVSKEDLNKLEQEAAEWFVNSHLKINSSIFNRG